MAVSISEYKDLLSRLRGLDSRTTVGIEGFTGSGKSTLAKALGRDLLSGVIHLDEYAIRRAESRPYVDCLDLGSLARAIAEISERNGLRLIEGVCLRAVLSLCMVRPNLYLYVKRVGRGGLWHDGLHLEEFERGVPTARGVPEPHQSDFAYHVKFQPHRQANWEYRRSDST